MNIILANEINKIDAREDMEVFSEISFYSKNAYKLEQLIEKIRDQEELLSTLNMLGQNIEYINTKEKIYKHLGRTVGISQLSRGERVLLAAYAANESHTYIALRYDIFQLSDSSKRKFFKRFKNSDYITLIADNQDDYTILSKYLREANYEG